MYISWWCSVPSVRPLNVWEKSSIQSSVGNAEDNNTIYGQPPSRAVTFLLFAGRLPRGWVRRMAMIDKGPGKRQGDQANRGLAAQTPSRGSVFGLADGMFRRWLLQWYMLWHRIIDFIAEIARYGDLCNRDGCMPRRSLSGGRRFRHLPISITVSGPHSIHLGNPRSTRALSNEYSMRNISQKSTTAITALKRATLKTGRNNIKAHVCSSF